MFSFFLLSTLFLIHHGNGSGIISIRLDEYNNPGGLGDNGNCCDGIRFICQGYCDHYFIVCVDDVSGSPTNIRQCSTGRFTTGVITDRNHIIFSNTIGGTSNPAELPFESWPGHSKLKVEVWDSDSNSNDFVEFLARDISIQSTHSRQHMREEPVQIKKRTQLDMSIAVFCDDHWYGPACDIYCMAKDGHYDCRPDGTKSCHPGWTGPECSENVNECASDPCAKPGGQCVDHVNGYTCQCHPGYTGNVCETEIDECNSDPCQNNGTCSDVVDGFVCQCPLAFTGDLCESEVHFCDSGPCAGNATCEEVVGGFYCLCPANYTGVQCEGHVGACSDYQCGSGTCVLDKEGHPLCRCDDGWQGPSCEDNIDDCEGVSCPTNMTCVDLVASYVCACDNDDCQGVLTCAHITCHNGGNCVDGELGYACVCPDGFIGHHCEVVGNVSCTEEPCRNNGTCVHTNTTAECQCPPGHSGVLCEIVELTTSTPEVTTESDPCLSSPCYRGATCVPLDGHWTCRCPENLMGTTCDSPTANITHMVMENPDIPSNVVYFYGTTSEKETGLFRRWLNNIAGDGVLAYVTAEYCTSSSTSDTIGVFMYKLLRDGEAVKDEVMERIEEELERGDHNNLTLKLTMEEQCESVDAGYGEAWIGRNWWVLVLVVVALLVLLSLIILMVLRRKRQGQWAPQQREPENRRRDFSVSSTVGVLTQAEALDALNSDRCYNNLLYQSEEPEYATVT